MDEPTLVGRRPVRPTRNAQREDASDRIAPVPLPPRVPSLAHQLGQVRSASHTEILAQTLFEPKALEDALVAAAEPVFLVVAQLRVVACADIGPLRRGIVQKIRRFEEQALKYHAPNGDVSAARYVICALVDETVMTTPWGSRSAWSDNSLLSQFHNETWGGEKVFQIVDRVIAEPAKYLALLKLINLCLLMGFEGKYRVADSGRERLEDLRSKLQQALREYTASPPAELSSQWRAAMGRTAVHNYLPLWSVFAGAALIVLIGYGFLRWRLSVELAPVEQLIDLISRSDPF